ncbi:MAG: alkylhydroperoxidase family enzyme [Chlamydiales bacterium]|jgi:alkylhydroperoxidase family enzyme
MKKVPADVVAAVRASTSLPTPELEALRTFALAVVDERGWVGGAPLEAFLAAGYSSRHALEVVLAVAFKTLSNYTNHMVSIPLDRAFASNTWSFESASVTS